MGVRFRRNLPKSLADKTDIFAYSKPESRRAIEIGPKDADVHDNLGGALADQGKLDDAIIECRCVIESDPKNENCSRCSGSILETQHATNAGPKRDASDAP